jgi:protein TonB
LLIHAAALGGAVAWWRTTSVIPPSVDSIQSGGAGGTIFEFSSEMADQPTESPIHEPPLLQRAESEPPPDFLLSTMEPPQFQSDSPPWQQRRFDPQAAPLGLVEQDIPPAPRHRSVQLPPTAAKAQGNENAPSAKSTDAAAGVAGPVAYGSNIAPVYPPQALRQRQQGTVYLMAILDERGYVVSLTIERSSGYPLLDQSAMQAVASWRYAPARIDGKPSPIRVPIPVRFVLANP